MRATLLTAANQPERAITEIEHGRSIYQSLYPAGRTGFLALTRLLR